MPAFATQGQAKRFFADKVITQAKAEGQPLSENQRWMLFFSESDPEFRVDPAQLRAFEAEIGMEEYEAKIAGLAKRACERDLDAVPSTLDTYRDAFRVLNQGDHYIAVMLKQGLAKWLRPWWAIIW